MRDSKKRLSELTENHVALSEMTKTTEIHKIVKDRGMPGAYNLSEGCI
jgi:hypothetical protein